MKKGKIDWGDLCVKKKNGVWEEEGLTRFMSEEGGCRFVCEEGWRRNGYGVGIFFEFFFILKFT